MSERKPARIPVRRLVFLDHDTLVFARNSLRDDKFKVEQNKAMEPEWEEKFAKAEALLSKLIEAAHV